MTFDPCITRNKVIRRLQKASIWADEIIDDSDSLLFTTCRSQPVSEQPSYQCIQLDSVKLLLAPERSSLETLMPHFGSNLIHLSGKW